MIQHVEEYFPEKYQALGAENTLKAVRYITEQAKKYGFTTQRNLSLYLGASLMLGSNFDTDPQYPWAIKILHDSQIKHPVKRIDQLDSTIQNYLDSTAGHEDEHYQSALSHFQRELLYGFTESASEKIGDTLLIILKKIYPRKYTSIENADLKKLIVEGIHTVKDYKIDDNSAIINYVTLTYLFGAKSHKDPLLPWVASSLNSTDTAEQKADTLKKETIAYINKLNS